MSDPQKTGKTLHRLKIEGDYLDARRNHVWIDGHLVETVTEFSVDLRMNASGVNAATISAILPDGIEVDVATDLRVDDKTAATLLALGWRPPLTEPRTFEYPVVGLPDLTALATEAIVQIADPDDLGKFFPVHFVAFCDKQRPWFADLPSRISAVLQDSVHPSGGGE